MLDSEGTGERVGATVRCSTIELRPPENGGTLTPARPRRQSRKAPLAARLAALSDRSGGPKACWPWLGARDKDGYGRLNIGGKTVPAHVAALEEDIGRDLGEGECSLHRCDNPPCTNPAHLFPGTKAVNNADAAAKGRTRSGDRSRTAKISHQDAEVIRRECAPGRYRRGAYSDLARRLGISSREVSYIAKGERWAS